MPTATVPAFIVDSRGRPMVWSGAPGSGGSTGVLYRRSGDDNRLRPVPPNHFADYVRLLSPQRYRELVSECRSLASRGQVAALLEQKSDYVAASGFRPRFMGSDTKWGATASAALEDALKICNLRGPRFDWRSSWRLAVPTRATDGRFFVLLTKWESGWPALQFLEGHRIGQRLTTTTTVGDNDAFTTITAEDGTTSTGRGLYRGMTINNGIITNVVGSEVAYRVLGATPEEDQDISARDMIHVASPQRYSEGCPAPDLARALMDFLALDTAQTCQLDQQIADAKITVVEKTATGRRDPVADDVGMSPTENGTPTEMVERANWRYIKSGVGELSPWKAERPSDQWMNFDQRVTSRAAAAIRWRAEMLDPTALKGAATRAFQDQINTCIADEFSTIAPACVRTVGYFVSCLIALKVIPTSSEWMRWEIAPPPWFEVDRASSKIDIDEVAGGRTAMSTLHQRDGKTTREVYMSNAHAWLEAEEVAKEMGVPVEAIRGDWGKTAQRTGTFSASPAKEETPPDNQPKE